MDAGDTVNEWKSSSGIFGKKSSNFLQDVRKLSKTRFSDRRELVENPRPIFLNSSTGTIKTCIAFSWYIKNTYLECISVFKTIINIGVLRQALPLLLTRQRFLVVIRRGYGRICH